MKKIVSVSLGSASRDHSVTAHIGGAEFEIQRIGTDGDVRKAVSLIQSLDGKVDVFGMGGISFYVYGRNNKRYTLKAALPIAQAAKKTPIVDGSGMKDTLERNVVAYLQETLQVPLADKKVLLVCAMDRFGMAEAFCRFGAQPIFGDLMFVLGVPIPLYKLSALHLLAGMLMPVVSRLPLKALYPTGQKQETPVLKYTRYYAQADIIAGDFLYIKKYMPEDMHGKIIVTNTVTQKDVDMLQARGAKMLLTSTPELNGRSFGTNVMEAVAVALLGKRPEAITPEDYSRILGQEGFQHRVECF